MTRVAAADLEGALRLSGEWHETRSVDELIAVAIGGFDRLVAADAVGWNEIDLVSGKTRFITNPLDYMAESDRADLGRLIAEHPIVGYYASSGDGSPVAVSDFLGVRAYQRSQLYCELYRPLGVEEQLAFAIEAGRLVTGVAFNRALRSFTARDRALLDLLRPHLVSAYANLRALEAACARLETLEHGLEEARRGVALIRDSRVEPTSRAASRLLRHWFDDGQPPLPEPGQPLAVERGERRLTLRRTNGDPSLLLLDETSFAPDPERARALGLNARETAVLALAARRLTDAEIARELFLSVRTVQKHLEHAYRKLSVHSRADAVARLLA